MGREVPSYLAPNEFWAVSGGVLYLSEDGGDSWKEIARGEYKSLSFRDNNHLLSAVGRDIAVCEVKLSGSR